MTTDAEYRERLFAHLQRGGNWAYYWTLPDKHSYWHPVGKNGVIPKGSNVYFGVHPTGTSKRVSQRSKTDDVQAVNCLFAEFDTKDFGGQKETCKTHIDALPLAPSVIIDSGGGFHCYWLLDISFIISTDSDRARIDRIQKAWVSFVGSDDGAKDLARVLRVPGTKNAKYNPARPVTFVSADFDLLYGLEDMEAISAAQPTPAPESAMPPAANVPHRSYAQAALDGEIARVRSAREGSRNTSLNVAAYSLGTLIGAGALSQGDAETQLLSAALAAGLTEREAQRTIRSGLTAGIAKPRQIPAGAAAQPVNTQGMDKAPVSDKGQELGEILRAKRLTNVGDAECLAAMHGSRLRYCHTRKEWFCWDDQRWKEDETGHAWRLMLDTVRARQAQIANVPDDDAKKRYAQWTVNGESARRLKDALDSASKLRELATTIDLYDKDTMLANAGGVTLDLRKCVARPNVQGDYITRRLGTDYDAGAKCPRWLQFLNEVFHSDQELIAYIQRAVGYSLTGDTREQKLFLCYGGGANGKSVFLTTIGNLLGEYATARTFATFDADERNRVGDDLAGLKGARFVSVIETNEDRRLNEARVKSLTGQDEITCRFLFGAYFSFRPTFKLWLAMNHKPTIHGVDRGIWRRIQLIPFTQSFEGNRQDKTLEDKLRAELPGILNWALDGLREWHRLGLEPPKTITEATEEYRHESDLVGQWLEACTVNGAQMEMKAGEGYKSYKAWCEEQGIKPLHQPLWSRRLVEHGVKAKPRTSKGVFYAGIGLLTIEHVSL